MDLGQSLRWSERHLSSAARVVDVGLNCLPHSFLVAFSVQASFQALGFVSSLDR